MFKKNSLAILILGISTVAIFSICLNNFFYTTDEWLIIEFAKKMSDNFSFSNISYLITNYFADRYSLPMRILPRFSWALDYSLWGINTLGYHITNLCFHLFSGIILYQLLNKLFCRKKLSFFAALIFLIHPLNSFHVESIGSRYGLMCTFFYLLSVFMFLTFLTKGYKVWYYIFSIICAFFALICKELALVLPFSIILIDIFASSGNIFFKKKDKDIKGKILYLKVISKRVVIRALIYLPYALLAFIFFIFMNNLRARGYLWEPGPLSSWFRDFPNINYLRLGGYTAKNLFFDLFKRFIFSPSDICRYFAIRDISNRGFIEIIIKNILFLFLLIPLFIRLCKKGKKCLRVIIFGAVWAAIAIIPILGTLTDLRVAWIETRHLYMVVIGLSVILVSLLLGDGEDNNEAKQSRKLQKIGIIVLCFLLLNFSYRTIEFLSLIKKGSFKGKAFVQGLEKILPGIPAKSNIFFIDNMVNMSVTSVMFSKYIQSFGNFNYYFLLKGTDLVFERDENRLLGMYLFKKMDKKFNLKTLDLGNTDFVVSWDSFNQNEDYKLIDITKDVKNLLVTKNSDILTGDINNNLFTWDFSKKENKPWEVVLDKIKKSYFFYNDEGLLIHSLSKFENPGDYNPSIVIKSPHLDVSANLIRKISINMKVIPSFCSEEEFLSIPGKPNAGKPIDLIQKEHQGMVMMGVCWITGEDGHYDRDKFIAFPIEADGEFHEYKIFPQNDPVWLKSGKITQIGIAPPLLGSSIHIKSIKLITEKGG